MPSGTNSNGRGLGRQTTASSNWVIDNGSVTTTTFMGAPGIRARRPVLPTPDDAPLFFSTTHAELLRRMREQQVAGDFLEALTAVDVPWEEGTPKKKKPKSEEAQFVEKINRMINDGEPVASADMSRYLCLVKKQRHVSKLERQLIHHPKDADGKTTASISCDDIIP